MTRSANNYVAEVGSILSDLPIPSITGAVMRGAGVRFSSVAEGIPGPRRIVIDTAEAGRLMASGLTAIRLLERQRRNFAYLEAQRSRLGSDEDPAISGALTSGWQEQGDHEAEVLDVLTVAPILPADFSTTFAKLADLAGLEQHGGDWRVMTSRRHWTGRVLEDLGPRFRLDALKAQTEANAARFRRWRAALGASDVSAAAPAAGPSPMRTVAAPVAAPPSSPPKSMGNNESARTSQEAARRHHERELGGDQIADRRRRFPELFQGIAFARGGVALSPAQLSDRRRRFPELFPGPSASPLSRDAMDDDLELG